MEFDIKQKMGPLPVWGWGLIIGALALVAYYLMNRGSNDGNYASDGVNLDATGYSTSGLSGPKELSEAAEATNDGWLADASARVAGALAVSPSDVRAALYKWLTGQDYTQAEKAWIDKALETAGSPPQGTTGQGTVTPTPPTVIKEQVKVPVSTVKYFTIRTASIYETATGTKRIKTVPKGTHINAVTSGGTPTRLRILLQAGTYAYIARANVKKG